MAITEITDDDGVVLARVRAFLPDFQASTNALLSQASQDPGSVNVETPRRGERAIAMDLGLGVYDAPGAAGREGEMESRGMGPVIDSREPVEMDDEESESEGEDEDEEEDEDEQDSSSDSDSASGSEGEEVSTQSK